MSYSVAAASRDSRELEPDTDAMVSHLRKMGSLNGEWVRHASTPQQPSPLFPLFTGKVAPQQMSGLLPISPRQMRENDTMGDDVERHQ